jgi:hypothetical protein
MAETYNQYKPTRPKKDPQELPGALFEDFPEWLMVMYAGFSTIDSVFLRS